jgi:hypothetical protein
MNVLLNWHTHVAFFFKQKAVKTPETICRYILQYYYQAFCFDTHYMYDNDIHLHDRTYIIINAKIILSL